MVHNLTNRPVGRTESPDRFTHVLKPNRQPSWHCRSMGKNGFMKWCWGQLIFHLGEKPNWRIPVHPTLPLYFTEAKYIRHKKGSHIELGWIYQEILSSEDNKGKIEATIKEKIIYKTNRSLISKIHKECLWISRKKTWTGIHFIEDEICNSHKCKRNLNKITVQFLVRPFPPALTPSNLQSVLHWYNLVT